jgi:hypothetical protein
VCDSTAARAEQTVQYAESTLLERNESLVTAAEKIKAKEDELRLLRRRETAFAVDAIGRIVLEKESDTDFEIALTEEEVERLRSADGVVFTHNHPRGWEYPPDDPRHAGFSFSAHDILLACRAELAEIRAVAPQFRFSMQPPAEGWNEAYWDLIRVVFETEKAELDRELTQRLHQGRISAAEYQTEYLHQVWLRVANLLGMNYSRSEE